MGAKIVDWLSVRNNLAVALIMLLITGALAASVTVVNQTRQVPELEKRVSKTETDIVDVRGCLHKAERKFDILENRYLLTDTVVKLQLQQIKEMLIEIKKGQ